MVSVSMRLQACSCHLYYDVHVVQLFHSINALCEFSVSGAPQNIAKGSATSTVVLAHFLRVPPMQCEVAIPHWSPQRPSTIFHKGRSPAVVAQKSFMSCTAQLFCRHSDCQVHCECVGVGQCSLRFLPP